jgi:signal transduction histidine kinase
MRTRCLEAPGRDRFGMAGAQFPQRSLPGGRDFRLTPLAGHASPVQRGCEVTPAPAQVVAAWPLGVSLAAAIAAQSLYVGRRRSALNEALHELRRPLQALALVGPGVGSSETAAIQGSVQMAATALERLEREINGGTIPAARTPVCVRPLLDSAVGRWDARAALAGGSLKLRWQADEVTVDADRCELSQAVDNLVVNAIEHGGPEIVVEACIRAGRLRLAVIDSGRESRLASRRESPAELVGRLSGRSRRGHGLRVVRRMAASHGGEFRLRCTERETEAVLDLPLAAGAG